jgi:hypothetical protein
MRGATEMLTMWFPQMACPIHKHTHTSKITFLQSLFSRLASEVSQVAYTHCTAFANWLIKECKRLQFYSDDLHSSSFSWKKIIDVVAGLELRGFYDPKKTGKQKMWEYSIGSCSREGCLEQQI